MEERSVGSGEHEREWEQVEASTMELGAMEGARGYGNVRIWRGENILEKNWRGLPLWRGAWGTWAEEVW